MTVIITVFRLDHEIYDSDNYRKSIVHHFWNVLLKIIKFGRNSAKLLAISLAARKITKFLFCRFVST